MPFNRQPAPPQNCGCSCDGQAFLAAGNGKLREDAVKAIGALLDWIAQQPGLDKSRVMVTGASYGGYIPTSEITRDIIAG